MPSASTPRRALVLKPCCIGDVLLATPLAAALRRAWPAAEIEWAVDAHSRPALRGNPHVDRCVDATGCVRGALDARAVAGLVRLLRRRAYDAVVVPDRSPLLALVAWLTGAPVRCGLDSGGRGRLHSVRVAVPRDPIVRHEAELYLDLARALGIAVDPSPRPVFFPSAADRADASRALAGVAPDATLVGLHPGGGVNPGMVLTEKRWPPDRYARLIERLVAPGVRPLLLGGPADRSVVDDVLERLSEAHSLACVDVSGGLSLGAAAAAIERCRVYIGNDSGVAHLAAAVGTPVVVVFGPTDPRRYGPLPGTGIAVSPAGGAVGQLADARGSRVIERVSVDAVWRAVAPHLGGPGSGG